MPAPKLAIEGLGKTFRSDRGVTVALHGVDLSINDNEFVALVGTSGCGKSTLLSIAAGLEEQDEGSVTIDGVAIEGPGLDRGVVFQSYTLLPWLTAVRNVEFALRAAGRSGAEAREIAHDHLQLVGLQGFENAYPAELSGGMKQRVAIARALAHDPEVILMDEPFGALDSQTRAVMQQLLLGIWEREHKTILFVTHDIDEALYLGEKVYVMSARPGRIIDTIAVDFAHPRSYELSTEPAFVELKRRIQHSLHAEVHKALAAAA